MSKRELVLLHIDDSRMLGTYNVPERQQSQQSFSELLADCGVGMVQ